MSYCWIRSIASINALCLNNFPLLDCDQQTWLNCHLLISPLISSEMFQD